jgi:hydrogenase maturation protease
VKPLILGLGNDLLGDDAVGLLAVRRLADSINGQADIVESNLSGIALLDLLAGRPRVIVVDAMQSGRHSPGSVVELSASDFRSFPCPSPHFTGLPELIDLAGSMDLEFPREISIIAVEIADACTIGADISKEVAQALPEIVNCIWKTLNYWSTKPEEVISDS